MAHQHHRVNGLIGQTKAGDIIALVAFWLPVWNVHDQSVSGLGVQSRSRRIVLVWRWAVLPQLMPVYSNYTIPNFVRASFVGGSAHVCVCVCVCVCVRVRVGLGAYVCMCVYVSG